MAKIARVPVENQITTQSVVKIAIKFSPCIEQNPQWKKKFERKGNKKRIVVNITEERQRTSCPRVRVTKLQARLPRLIVIVPYKIIFSVPKVPSWKRSPSWGYYICLPVCSTQYSVASMHSAAFRNAIIKEEKIKKN